MSKNQTIELGDVVRDRITGFVGVATATTTWLNGCIRINVQPEKLKDGKIGETETFDIQQLEVVKKSKVQPAAPLVRPGGPKPSPRQLPSARGMR